MFRHDFVWVAALLVPFNRGYFVLLLLLFTSLFSICFDLFDSELFVILFGNSLRIIFRSSRLVVSWIMLAVVDASFDTFEVLAVIVNLILLTMINQLVSCHRFLVK